MRQHQAMFANFILKFGEENLLDYLEEVVLPAFTDDTLYRQYAASNFYFYDVKIVDLKDVGGSYAIAGHFVQDTVLRRTQIFDPALGLVHDEGELDSAPSAFFVLTLADHKLIYYAETPDAPDLGPFTITVRRFIDRKYKKLIDDVYDKLRDEGERVTKKGLRSVHEEPTLEIIPIAGSADIEAFVGRYSVLKRLDILIHERNDEVDAAELLEGIDTLRERLAAKKAKLTISEGEGLSKEGAIETLTEAGVSGNQSLKLSGLDAQGNKLDGTNDDFSVRTQIDIPPLPVERVAERLFQRMVRLVDSGILAIRAVPAAATRRVNAIIENLE